MSFALPAKSCAVPVAIEPRPCMDCCNAFDVVLLHCQQHDRSFGFILSLCSSPRTLKTPRPLLMTPRRPTCLVCLRSRRPLSTPVSAPAAGTPPHQTATVKAALTVTVTGVRPAVGRRDLTVKAVGQSLMMSRAKRLAVTVTATARMMVWFTHRLGSCLVGPSAFKLPRCRRSCLARSVLRWTSCLL